MKYLIISILIHVILLFGVIPVELSDENKQDTPSGKDEKISYTKESHEIKTKLVDGFRYMKPECDRYYYGIGVSLWANWILEVAEGGPAHRAGVQVNDTWLNFSLREYKKGDTVDITVRKPSGDLVRYKILVDKICVTE